ncbi:MAG: formylglycine-generating enzyme family protein [Spirochaetaceae bacterium]|jgi:formylglycine-generating enzyme required for sulfatase activity|nr:formylglycine-generating enzyme family protein [Spirochaetaceae bacterium]
MKRYVLLLITALALNGGAVFSQTFPTAAVIPYFTVRGQALNNVDEDEARIADSCRNELAKFNGSLNVVDFPLLEQAMKDMSFQPADWSNPNKTAQLGVSLNADYLIQGQINYLGDRITFDLIALDIKTLEALASYTAYFTSLPKQDDSSIFFEIPYITGRLVAQLDALAKQPREESFIQNQPRDTEQEFFRDYLPGIWQARGSDFDSAKVSWSGPGNPPYVSGNNELVITFDPNGKFTFTLDLCGTSNSPHDVFKGLIKAQMKGGGDWKRDGTTIRMSYTYQYSGTIKKTSLVEGVFSPKWEPWTSQPLSGISRRTDSIKVSPNYDIYDIMEWDKIPFTDIQLNEYSENIPYIEPNFEKKSSDYEKVFSASTPSLTQPPQSGASATPPVQPVQAPAGFALIPGGTFKMGSPALEPERYDDEVQHTVTVSPFYMSKYEVTQREYEEIMGTNPSRFKGSTMPVEQVTWFNAVEYCNRRSQREGLTPAYMIRESGEAIWNWNANGYRLPTEAEWEYACRAGTSASLATNAEGSTPFSTGNNLTTNQANYDGNFPYNGNIRGTYRKATVPVGSFAPNGWGLYDMHGNVWEWCWDWYGLYSAKAQTNPVGPAVGGAGPAIGNARVVRGGSWGDYGKYLRSAYRDSSAPSNQRDSIGFRLALPCPVQ